MQLSYHGIFSSCLFFYALHCVLRSLVCRGHASNQDGHKRPTHMVILSFFELKMQLLYLTVPTHNPDRTIPKFITKWFFQEYIYSFNKTVQFCEFLAHVNKSVIKLCGDAGSAKPPLFNIFSCNFYRIR